MRTNSVILAIQKAITLQSQYNIRVINLSLGRGMFESYTATHCAGRSRRRGSTELSSQPVFGGRDNAQNTNGYGTINAPRHDPLVITVGAMKDELTLTRSVDMIASYSSKGPTLIDHVVKPDIVAPGNRIISLLSKCSTDATTYPANAVPLSYYETGNPTGSSATYHTLSGTSMATPMVAGTAALMIQKNSTLTPNTVKARLMMSATKNFPAFSTVTDLLPASHIRINMTFSLLARVTSIRGPR